MGLVRFMFFSLSASGMLLLSLIAPLNAASVLLSWDANTDADLAGYRIYFGTSSGNYEHSVYAGNQTSYPISNLKALQRYYFVVTAIDFSGNESRFSREVDITVSDNNDDAAAGDNQAEAVFGPLTYNYPNPFNPDRQSTTIRYELLQGASVTIDILDADMTLITRPLFRQPKFAGVHTLDTWNGENNSGSYVANGIYFCVIRADNQRRVIKIAVSR